MGKGYIIADGESVGLVCLSVHYEDGGMFVAHNVKAHAPLPSIKRAREACMPVVNDFLLGVFSARQTPTAPASCEE
jgi:hypothetical protein